MAVLASHNALGAVPGDVYGGRPVIHIYQDGRYVFGKELVSEDVAAADINPRFGAEFADSGAATAAGLTYLAPGAGLPAADKNDVIENVGTADIVIGGHTIAPGGALRAVRPTPGGVDADWVGYSPTTTYIKDVPDVTVRNALTGLSQGNIVIVDDDTGSGEAALYRITAAGDGTWAGATKVQISGGGVDHVSTANPTIRDALTGLQNDQIVFVDDDTGTGDGAIYRIVAAGDGTWGGATKQLVTGGEKQGGPFEPLEAVTAGVDIRSAPEPDPIDQSFGETFLFVATVDRTTSNVFDVAEKNAGWRRLTSAEGVVGIQQPETVSTLEARDTSGVNASSTRRWQTIVPGVDGQIIVPGVVDLNTTGPGPVDALVELWEGSDPATGTLVPGATATITGITNARPQHPFTFTSPSVETGKTYSLSVIRSAGTDTLQFWTGTDAYPNGAASIGAPNDHKFSLTITPTAAVVAQTIFFRGSNGAQIVETRNLFWSDENVGPAPAATQGGIYWTGVVQSTSTNYDPANPDAIDWTEYVAVEDPADLGTYYWSADQDVSISGNTRYVFYASERLQSMRFTVHDRRSRYVNAGTRFERTGLTVDELSAGSPTWALDAANAPAGYTRVIHRHELSPGGSGYDYTLDWRLSGGEYEFILQDTHNSADGSTVWGVNRMGAIRDLVYKYSDADPPKANWVDSTAYAEDDVVVGTAPAGVGETAGEKYFIQAPAGGRPNTVATLDAAEWGLWQVIGGLQIFGSGERVVDGTVTENLHAYLIKVPESQVFIVPAGVTQTFLLNQDPATVTVENHTNGLYGDIDVAGTSKTVTLVGPARLTYTVNHILAERLQTAAAISYQDTADGQTLEWNKYYILHPTFNYTFPLVTETAGSNWLVALPSNQNWQAFTGTWSGSGTDTVGAGQLASITAESDAIRFVGSLGVPSNVVLHVGGDATAPLFESIETRAALPDPTTVPSGTIYNVTNDTAALSGLATAFGPVAGNALGWSS